GQRAGPIPGRPILEGPQRAVPDPALRSAGMESGRSAHRKSLAIASLTNPVSAAANRQPRDREDADPERPLERSQMGRHHPPDRDEGRRTQSSFYTGLCFTSLQCGKCGGQGWTRTSVRKPGQIYSLLPLTTRPPVHGARRSEGGSNDERPPPCQQKGFQAG